MCLGLERPIALIRLLFDLLCNANHDNHRLSMSRLWIYYFNLSSLNRGCKIAYKFVSSSQYICIVIRILASKIIIKYFPKFSVFF